MKAKVRHDFLHQSVWHKKGQIIEIDDKSGLHYERCGFITRVSESPKADFIKLVQKQEGGPAENKALKQEVKTKGKPGPKPKKKEENPE